MAVREIDIVKRSEPEAGPGSPEDDSPLSPLQKKLTGKQTIKFPQNIDAVDNYIMFSAYKEHSFQGSTGGMQRSNMSKLQTVILPMPSNLTTGYNQSYKEEAVGAAGMVIGGAIGNDQATARATLERMGKAGQEAAGGDFKGAFEDFKSIGENAMSRLGQGGVLGAALNVATGEVGAGIAAGLAGPIGAAAATKGVQVGMAIAGIARNPHMAVLYDTPQFRAFSFGFEFRPKNQYESLSIAQIIHFFKFYSHPEYIAGGHFFEYPNQFKIGYKHPEFLHSFQDAVCKSVTVDYHGEGTPLYYDASNLGSRFVNSDRKLLAPAVVKMQVDFQEVKIITKKDIERKGR